MARARRFWAMALLAILLCAAALPASADSQPDTAALLADFDELVALLEADYPFLPVLAERGIDFEALCASARRGVERCEDVFQFYDEITLMLSGMDNFAHLSVVTPELYRFYVENPDVGPAPVRRMIADDRTRQTYAALNERRASRPSVHTEVETAWYPEEKALVFRVASFDSGLLDRDRNAVTEGVAAHPDAAHIVFDITGNRGGGDDYWSAAIVAPFGGAYSHELTDFTRDTPLCRTYFGAENLRPVAEYPGELPDFVTKLGLTHFVIDTETIPFELYEGPVVETGAKRWVLIDGGVYSAADGFARFCKDTGWATLVGTPTGGCGAKGSAPLIARLPNTGLLVRFDAAAAANDDGTLNAVIGTKPDVPCKPGETPLQACLRAIAAHH